MSTMRLLWWSLGLAALGFLLIWAGTVGPEFILWIGIAIFVLAMLLAPATRYVEKES
ncbi:MAG: hypothetical protein QME94_19325 [Anaerolineae bacterium]|nr:hypothetical protein [Anaerolineae bacterium]